MAPHPAEKDISSASHVEEQPVQLPINAMGEMKVPISDLKLDEHGLPLVPQPSDHKDDPLVSVSSRVLLLKDPL